jgi:hypothetical protein
VLLVTVRLLRLAVPLLLRKLRPKLRVALRVRDLLKVPSLPAEKLLPLRLADRCRCSSLALCWAKTAASAAAGDLRSIRSGPSRSSTSLSAAGVSSGSGCMGQLLLRSKPACRMRAGRSAGWALPWCTAAAAVAAAATAAGSGADDVTDSWCGRGSVTIRPKTLAAVSWSDASSGAQLTTTSVSSWSPLASVSAAATAAAAAAWMPATACCLHLLSATLLNAAAAKEQGNTSGDFGHTV